MGDMVERLLREPEVCAQTGDSRSVIWVRAREGLFIPPVRTGPRRVGWPQSEVQAIIRARIAGKTDDEIRALVAELVAARSAKAAARNAPRFDRFSTDDKRSDHAGWRHDDPQSR